MTIEKQMSSKESQYPHLYNEAEKIETKRMNDDLLYNVIMNPDTTILQRTVDCFVSELEKNYIGRSTRLKRMMEISKSTDNRLLKHSLIFFCLYQEPFAVSYFMKDNACPPDKLSSFVSGELQSCCEQLLKGSYTSLQAFVEDARWQYVVL